VYDFQALTRNKEQPEMRARILISALALGGTMLTGCASQPAPPPQSVAGTTTGTITFTGGAVALGIGYQWGSGVLTYGGVDYPFKVSGLSVIDVGASRVTGTGRVSGLRKLSDFNGNYVAATAGATLAGGGSATVLRNQNGVTIDGIASSQGARLTLAPSGVNITLSN
jgi:hypothetical protein